MTPPPPLPLYQDAISRYLADRARPMFGEASVYVVLEPMQTAWRSDGGQYVGPGVVHYWRTRDDYAILSRVLDTATVAEIVTACPPLPRTTTT
jgi:hypothetical protein